MNKADLIDRIAEKTQTSKAAAARVFEAIFDASSGAIAEAVQAGKHVSIPGFGKFRTKERAARKGRNPQTGTEINIPASTVVSFAAAKTLRETVKTKGAGGAAKGGGSAAKTSSRGAAAKSAKPAARSSAPATKTAAKGVTAGSAAHAKRTSEKSSVPAAKSAPGAKSAAPAKKSAAPAKKSAAPAKKSTTKK